MRLITHNLLACHSRLCSNTSNNFPLQIKDAQLTLLECEYNESFLRGFLPKIEWQALVTTARQLGDTSLPDESPDLDDAMLDEKLLRNLHHVLLELEVTQGSMTCPNCNHVYGIRNGIPNMLLAEHEISR